jgi:hypothetical protein
MNNTFIEELYEEIIGGGINKELCMLSMYFYILSKKINKLNIPNTYYPVLPFATKLGFQLGDFYSGLYHYFMDTYDFSLLYKLHENFRKHHDNPLSMEKFPWMESITEITPIGIPMLFLIEFDNQLFQYIHILSNMVMCSASISHRFAHRRTHENDKDKNGKKIFSKVPEIIRYLQDNNIILNPKHHKKHHKLEITNYCISNGSTSKLMNKIINLFELPISTYKNSKNIHKIYKTNKEKKEYLVSKNIIL